MTGQELYVLQHLLQHDTIWPTAGLASRPTMEQVLTAAARIDELFIMQDKGFVAITREEDGVGEVHCGFLKDVRGNAAMQFCKSVLARTRFKRLITRPNKKFKEAAQFAATLGFKRQKDVMVYTKA